MFLNMKLSEALQAFFLTLFLFGLLVWVYVVTIQITHPIWLSKGFTHIDLFPLNVRVDVMGIVAFIVSAVSFFLWQLTCKTQGGSRQAKRR